MIDRDREIRHKQPQENAMYKYMTIFVCMNEL